MNTDILRSELIDKEILKEIIYFEELESTNEYAKKNNAHSDTIVIASHQTSGKGRFNRQWKTSHSKDLTFSIVKSFNIRVDEIHLVNFYTSYMLLTVLKNYFLKTPGLNFSLKWPNDILLNRKKIAGLLLDVKDLNSEFKKFIIGIGINCNGDIIPEELQVKATSLFRETNSEINRENFLVLFVTGFYENLFLLNNKNDLMQKWKDNSHTISSKVSFRKVDDDEEQPVTVTDIDPDGALIVKTEEGKIMKYYSGEISLGY